MKPGQRGRRPVGVKLVVAFGLFQAVVLGVLGAAMFAVGTNPDQLAEGDLIHRDVEVVAALLCAVALVQLLGAIGLYRGNARIRTLYGVVATLQIGSAVYAMVALRNVQGPSLVVLSIAVGIEWFLYGSERTQEFFA